METEIVYLGLGSSEGDTLEKELIISESFEEIKKWGKSEKNGKISSFYYSEPWGGVAKNMFVNAVCCIETHISPEKLLEKIHQLEKKFGRVRKKKWGDRTLDIDILLYGNQKINTEKLIIPHKYMWERDFVFQPLKELVGNDEILASFHHL